MATRSLWLSCWLLSCISGPSFSAPLSTETYDKDIKSAVRKYWPDVPHWKLWKAQLFQESKLDPHAVSPVGARGLAQFMPATFQDVTRQLGLVGSPHDDLAIEAGAFYMAKLRQGWKGQPRTGLERHDLALASYNAGMGNVIKAQQFCGNARLWGTVKECLPKVTGQKNAHETTTYVERIAMWWKKLELT